MKGCFLKQAIVVFLCSFLFFIFPSTSTKAALADGTYSINYTVIQPDSDSVSIANDYFVKPATLTIENGVMKVKITLKNSEWITDFKATGGGNSIVSTNESANTRVVQFNVNSLSKPLEATMKVDIDDMNYHHEYTVRINFNESSVALTSAPTTNNSSNESSTETSTNNQSSTTETETETEKEKNPQTSDSSALLIAFVLLLGSTALVIRRYQMSK